MSEYRVYIGDAAEQLDRRVGTLRKWERDGWLPDDLKSTRDERGWRYWTPAQIERIREWMIEVDLRPGRGLPTYDRPSPERVAEHLRRLRQPRNN
jgi:MerR HTH family regulatory protein